MTPTALPAMKRRLLLATPCIAAAGLIADRARANEVPQSGPSDIGVYCEPTLALAIRAAGLLFAATASGGPVAVLTAPASLLLAQIGQNPADDLLIVPRSSMDEAARRGFIDPATRIDHWRNRLVMAVSKNDAASAGAIPPAQLFATGRLAATDATPASTLDGMAVLGRLGLAEKFAGRLQGAANTADVAFMVRSGAVRFGLVLMTDVRADPDLAVAWAPDATLAPPVVYAAALNARKHSRNARPFLGFLQTPSAAEQLRQLGLEPV